MNVGGLLIAIIVWLNLEKLKGRMECLRGISDKIALIVCKTKTTSVNT